VSVRITGRRGGRSSGVEGCLLRRSETPARASLPACVTAFAWRTMLKIKHVPEQLFDVVITPVLFTVLFTYMFGGALMGSIPAYLQFLLPGILVQTVVFTSIHTGLALNTDIPKGVFDRFKSMPIWQPSPIVGAMMGDVLRFTLSSLIVFGVGLAMGYRPAGVAGVIATLLLVNVFALGLSWVFIVLGLIVRSPSTMMTLSWLFLMPFTFASNIYVDPATMPDWLQTVVALNPVSHVTTAVRGALGGVFEPLTIGLALVAPVLLTGVVGPVALVLYHRER
jgi:ABC-2 type transport system permease protein